VNQSAIECREASREDLPAILALHAEPDMYDGEQLSLQQAQQLFDRMAAYPHNRLYLAELDGVAVGTFALLVMDSLGHAGAPVAVVEDVVVATDARRRGVGKAMMQFAMQLSAQKGCYKLMLSSHLGRTEAHVFYDGLGFERHGYSFRLLTD
jgi:GNAT superfamily N-acetyltransferase